MAAVLSHCFDGLLVFFYLISYKTFSDPNVKFFLAEKIQGFFYVAVKQLVVLQISEISDTEIHPVDVPFRKAIIFYTMTMKINVAIHVIKFLAIISPTWRIRFYDHFQQGDRAQGQQFKHAQ